MQQAHRAVNGIRLHRLAHPSCETFRALAEGTGTTTRTAPVGLIGAMKQPRIPPSPPRRRRHENNCCGVSLRRRATA